MKKVVNKEQVAHLWANQLQDEARVSGYNFYFRGNTIYSYGSHFPIAKHVERNGINKVLFTLRSYSNTTAKHISVVRNACSNKKRIYCYHIEGTYNDNFAAWQKEAEYIGQKLIKAKKPQIYLGQLENIREQVNTYCEFYEINMPEILEKLLNVGNKEELLEYNQNLAEYKKQEEAKKLKALEAKLKTDLKKWYNFETSYLYSRIDKDYIRLNTENNRFETSQRVEIPFAIAKKFYELLSKNIIKVGDKLLEYSVNYIDDKLIKIGCHTFEIAYLNKLAKKHF